MRYPFVVLVIALLLCAGSVRPAALDQPELDISAVRLLVEILQTARNLNPGYEQVAREIQTAPEGERQHTIDSAITQNAAKTELTGRIDSLLHLPAYQLYYHQFKNITPDVHRRILLALPFAIIPSPADISANLYRTTQRIDSIAAWVDNVVSKIDLVKSRNIAAQWLPPGDTLLPKVYMFLDGNSDAFARDGAIGFDVYSLVLRPYLETEETVPSEEASLLQVQHVLAHELHHIYANRYFTAEPAEKNDWKLQWRNRLVRLMALEGTATHCAPPEGLNRAAKEDTAVVAHWIKQCNARARMVRDGQLDPSAAYAWRDSTYHPLAMDLLRLHLSKKYQGEELQKQVKLHSQDRPSLIYTLGWWMTSRLSSYGANPQPIQSLVMNPLSLVETYNQTLPPGADSLRIEL